MRYDMYRCDNAACGKTTDDWHRDRWIALAGYLSRPDGRAKDGSARPGVFIDAPGPGTERRHWCSTACLAEALAL